MNTDALFAAIDAANHADPEQVTHDGKPLGACELYGIRMTQCQQALYPAAGTALQIACRAQHLERWVIARKDYPMDRQGYHRWRTELGKHHADRCAEILAQFDAPATLIEQTSALLRKEKLKTNPDTQCLEDVACLVFLSHYFADFSAKHPEEKVIDILRKTWRKMSDNGQKAALALTLPAHLSTLVGKALQA
ncbi:DUF4202 domain-containing protein [Simiduia agarivorans]|uniref:Glutamyl-tRNA synthetase n=1 Tax=Simiduia agarivorans (strain DSM 21679 / JCM 13881 / BCRC 17597 / SA1) TaxID=1117647 RepID=K4KHE1_SIMAS|nr:DUF4202 domain-containing protein [Simiduia agarivorans]AFU97615.1 hypothetical protein M5M_01980 [Simiduia agarivorans SA1 = DSM 21679]